MIQIIYPILGIHALKNEVQVGDKTAEIAKVVDQTYKDKVGPKGQTIYIDNRSKYYYINTEGKKIYVKKSQLKDKPAP